MKTMRLTKEIKECEVWLDSVAFAHSEGEMRKTRTKLPRVQPKQEVREREGADSVKQIPLTESS